MSKANLKLCPSCLLEIIGGDEVTTCPDCGVTYHKSCWEIEKQCKDDQCPGNKEESRSYGNESVLR